MPEPAVVHNEQAKRFEVALDGGEPALAVYERRGDTLAFVHTEVPEEHEGQGVGTRLVRAGLDYARSEGLRVAPYCAFFAAHLRAHPDDQDLVVDGFPL